MTKLNRNSNGQFSKTVLECPNDRRDFGKYYYRVTKTNKVRYRIHILRSRIAHRKRRIIAIKRYLAINERLIREMQAEIEKIKPFREPAKIQNE